LVVGELPNSYAKRRLGVEPGTRGPAAFVLIDQFDLVPAIWILLLPVYVMPLPSLALAIVVVTAVHMVINVIGYAIGARTAPV
ncbi:MAG: CDP-archaeol synthase, partial [Thermoleophilaceae bacterium]|nr:CDP-archaeol synthase [Thermoleophilaceae bacterium]